VEYGITIPNSQGILYWHVEFGIAMFWIAIFHIHSYWMSSSEEGEDSSPDKSGRESD